VIAERAANDLTINYDSADGVEAAETALTGDPNEGRKMAAKWRLEETSAQVRESMGP
jgi:hypothetical protein